MKVQYSESELKEFEQTEEGKAYLEYNNCIGGEPLGLIVPFGYPKGVSERGGVIAVYKECIRKGKTWEKLLGVEPVPEDADI
jgi:hypothetical protein